MADALNIELTQEAKNLISRLGASDGMLRAVAREMDTQNQFTVDEIGEKRLTGKGPFPVAQHRLGERTHRLRPTLRRTTAQITGTAVEGSIGTNVEYAGTHEFGFQGEVMVKPHSRRTYQQGQWDYGYKRLGKRVSKRVKVRGKDTFVGAFKRKMNIPARAPITTGVTERIPALGAEVSRAIVTFWNQERGIA